MQDKRAVTYTRVSTAKQAGEGLSLAEQERATRARAEADGFECVDTYVDAGLSGRRGDRPELNRLLADAERGMFDRVYTFKLDRISRRAADLLMIDQRFERAGVSLVSITDGIDTSTANGRLLRTVLAAVAEAEVENTSERVRLASHARAREGRRNGGPRPFGYMQRGGELLVVPHEAEVVKRVFREYLSGRSQTAIARRLNADGISTVRGAPWCQQRVRDLLANRLYVGFVRNHDQEFPGIHEPILDEEVWEQVAQIRSAKRRAPGGWRARPTAGTHLFTNGMLRCGACGSPMLPRSIRRKQGRRHEIYLCASRYGRVVCAVRPYVRREEVDRAVLEYFLAVGLDYEATRSHFEQRAEREIAETAVMLEQAEVEERRTTAQIDRVTRDYRDGQLTAEEWRFHLGDLEPERDAATAQVSRLTARLAEIRIGVAASRTDAELDALRYLASVRAAIGGAVRDADGVSAVRVALLRLFDRFVLHHPRGPAFPSRVYADLMCVGEDVVYAIEPIVREDVVEGVMEHGTPILRRVGVVGAGPNEREKIQAVSGR